MGHLHPQLEVIADDFGMSTGVSEATLTLAEAGRIDAISVLVPKQPTRLLALRSERGVRLGMHWAPVGGADAPYSRLAPLVRDAYLSKLDDDGLNESFEQQLFEFKAALGISPDFVDSHMHVHQLPGMRVLFNQFLERHGLKCARATQVVFSPEKGRRAWVKRRVLKHFGGAFAAGAEFAPVFLTLDYASMDPQTMAAWMADELKKQAGPVQLIVHPGLAQDSELKSFDSLWQGRDKDSVLLERLSLEFGADGTAE